MTGSRVRAVLLDCMGTLIGLEPPGAALVDVMRSEHGIELERQAADTAFAAEIAYYRARHMQGRDAATLAALRGECAEVLAAHLPVGVTANLSGEQMTAAMLASLHFVVWPDVPGALEALKAYGVRAVVASNWDCGLPALLADVGLASRLDGVVVSAAVGTAKPAQEIFAAALALAGVQARDAVHVGDSYADDVEGATAAGLGAVWLRRAGAGAHDEPDPQAAQDRQAYARPGASTGVRQIGSLAQLPGLIVNWSG